MDPCNYYQNKLQRTAAPVVLTEEGKSQSAGFRLLATPTSIDLSTLRLLPRARRHYYTFPSAFPKIRLQLPTLPANSKDSLPFRKPTEVLLRIEPNFSAASLMQPDYPLSKCSAVEHELNCCPIFSFRCGTRPNATALLAPPRTHHSILPAWRGYNS